jgi:2-iminobutanoate/2-iminopropanoate deaminase
VPFKEVKSPKLFASPAPFSMATLTGTSKLLHISGQVSQGSDGRTIGPGDIEKQTIRVIENIQILVTEQGGSLSDICKITIFLTSRDHLPVVMEVRKRMFKPPFPATSAVIVSGLANAEWMIEIEAIAALP